jgi:hypothetical protein
MSVSVLSERHPDGDGLSTICQNQSLAFLASGKSTRQVLTSSVGLQVMYTLVGILCGTVFFQEWKDMSILALCMYGVGFLGMAVGIRVGISARELAEGLEQMDERDFDADVSDGASGQHSHHLHLQWRLILCFEAPFAQKFIVPFRTTL